MLTDRIAELLPSIGRVLVPIGLGLLLRAAGIFDEDEGAALRKFVVRFTVPIFVFFSLYEARPESIAAIGPMVGAFLLLTGVLFLLGWAVALRFPPGPQRPAVHACVALGNYGWLGLGVAQALLGDAGTQRVLFFILLWWPVFYTTGLAIGFIHVGRQNCGAMVGRAMGVAVPALAAVALGLGANLTSVSVPTFVSLVLRPFGDMTVPLILLSVGLLLDVRRVTREVKAAVLISVLTLAAAPLAGWGIAALVAGDAVTQRVIILEAAMPVATLVPLLAEGYEMDTDLVGTAIVLSTLLSLVTLPVVAALVM